MDKLRRSIGFFLLFFCCFLYTPQEIFAAKGSETIEKQEVKQEAEEVFDELEDDEGDEPLSQIGENIVTNPTFEKAKEQQPTSPEGWERSAVKNT